MRALKAMGGLGLFAALAWFALSQSDGRVLANLGLADGAALSLLSVAALGVNAGMFLTAGAIFGIRMPAGKGFQLTALNSLLNSLIPLKAGLAFRGLYMQRVLGLAWPEYLTMTAVAQLIIMGLALATLAGIVLLAVPLALPTTLAENTLLLVALPVLLAFLVGCRVLAVARNGLLSRVREGVVRWGIHRRLALQYGVLTMVFLLLGAARLYLAFAVLGFEAPVLAVTALHALFFFGSVIAITPGNLGVKEGGVFLLAPLFLLQPEEALLAALLDRAFAMLVTLLFGAYAVLPLSRDITTTRAAAKE